MTAINRQRLARVGIRASVIMVITVVLSLIAWRLYLPVAAKARTEERMFWRTAGKMTLEERSALLNHVVRTGRIPGVLPWWEYSEDVCSATAIKYVSLFTGVKFVHAPAWRVRTHRINHRTVPNERKLTTIWDHTTDFDGNGRLTSEKKEELTAQVVTFPFDPQKVYVFGLLWEDTRYWEKIKAEGPDINSHLAFFSRGRAIHFIHQKDGSDPLRIETLQELFADGKLLPVWIAEVHPKSGEEFRLPQTDRQLAFRQNKMPWETIRKYLLFPRGSRYLPGPVARFTHAVVDKSLLFHARNGYDLYPRFVLGDGRDPS